jgi:hypothetical protein
MGSIKHRQKRQGKGIVKERGSQVSQVPHTKVAHSTEGNLVWLGVAIYYKRVALQKSIGDDLFFSGISICGHSEVLNVNQAVVKFS